MNKYIQLYDLLNSSCNSAIDEQNYIQLKMKLKIISMVCCSIYKYCKNEKQKCLDAGGLMIASSYKQGQAIQWWLNVQFALKLWDEKLFDDCRNVLKGTRKLSEIERNSIDLRLLDPNL